MATNQQQQPKNIFECINLNIVDLSQEVLAMRQKVEKIDGLENSLKAIDAKLDCIINALFPPTPTQEETSEPNTPGAE